MDGPLFCDGWTGREELKLLSVIEEQGYGNWSSIGQRMNKSGDGNKVPFIDPSVFDSLECFSHYYHYYISNPVSPLKSVTRDQNFASLFAKKSHDPLPSSHDESHDCFPLSYPGQEIPHYNPLREEFEIECFDEAEKVLSISSLALDESGEDSEDDVLLKELVLALVDSYWRTLKERKQRKKIIREHSLIDIYKIMNREKGLPLFEQSVRIKMRQFVRFLDSETLEKIIQSSLYEHKLIEKIKRLQNYRSQGIKTLAAAKVYEKLKERRKTMNEKKLKAFEEIHKASKMLKVLSSSKNITSSAVKPKQTVAPLNITYSPGIDLLDEEEKEICSVHRILPDVFIRCKNVMLSENRKGGHLRLMEARRLCRIDVNKTRKIYNLLVQKKLIQLPP